ncbi:DMT family transporter [Bacillus sp. B15-48]|uniref:DMT family transporter n=1 Tax=Bacillus sp. B15-48 TaxID=1548601 RepID=UPI001940159A|nr:DMT family transporter [Bacillus sp. B15-48]MBM4763213.1 EamA family transporter [Bacillus sp. B15-48]
MNSQQRIKPIIGIAFIVLVWGSVWPIYKVALEYTPPILFSAFRSLLGGVLFTLFLLPQWRKIRLKETWPIYTISTIFNVVLFFTLQTIGLQYLPSGLFAVLVYLQPVLVVLLAWIWLKEPLTVMKVVGILIGFFGVVFISSEGITGNISTIGVTLALITGISWAIGTVYIKRTSGFVDGLWLVAIQNLIGGSTMTILGLTMEDVTTIEWNVPLILCILYGAIFGVTLAFVVYYKLMRAGEAGKVSSFTFLVPLISVLIGTVFLKEPFTLSLFVGMIMILVSIYLINRKSLKPNTHTVKNNQEILKDA